ncbi:MAG: phosphoribosyltransferase [Bacteroidota bacterium]|jgi:putative phosphoribosyl transferase
MDKLFKDREHAGKELAEKLIHLKGNADLVFGIPRGGIPVAAEIADTLGCPLEVLLCKKIGHPNQKEYAIGAASLTDIYLIPHEQVDEIYLQEEIKKVRKRLKEMQRLYSVKEPKTLNQKTIIITDDGMATGRTMMAAIRLLKQSRPLKIILAIPVASTAAKKIIEPEVDELIILYEPEWFTGVGAFYQDFEQVSDEAVIARLKKPK